MFRKLSGIRICVTVIFLILVATVVLTGCTNDGSLSGAGSATNVQVTDPQRLMIPRWFLSSLTLDGQDVAVAEDQQSVTLQFAEAGNANGTGGCNQFGTTFSTGADGKIAFGPIAATKMACDQGMELENAYFLALSRVERFSTEDNGLILSSADGKTALTFRMPPK